MAKLYGRLNSDKNKEVSRTAYRKITSHLSGWNVGIETTLELIDDVYTVRIYKTGGSNNPSGTLIKEFEL